MRFSPIVTNNVTVPPGRRWMRPDYSQKTTQMHALPPSKPAISPNRVFTPPQSPYPPDSDKSEFSSAQLTPTQPYLSHKFVSALEPDEDDEIFVDADDGSARNIDEIGKPGSVHLKSLSPKSILTLPTPTTARRPESVTFDRLSLYRSLPILTALLVALVLLICLTIMFFIELEKIDSELHAHYRLPLAHDETNSTPSHHSRRLASLSQPEKPHRSTVDQFIPGFQLMKRLFSSSKLDGLPMAFLFSAFSTYRLGRKPMVVEVKPADIYQHPIQMFQPRGRDQGYQHFIHHRPGPLEHVATAPSPPSRPDSIPKKLLKISNSDNIDNFPDSSEVHSGLLLGSTSTIRPGVSPGVVPGEALTGRSNVAILQRSLHPPASGSTSPSRLVAKVVPVAIPAPVLAIPLVPPNPQPSNTKFTSLPLQAILHNGPVDIIEVVKDESDQSVNTSSSPGAQSRLSQSSSSVIQSQTVSFASPSPSNTPSFANTSSKSLSQPISAGNQSPSVRKSFESKNEADGIEVWRLPRGKYICRFHNVARTEDGRMFIPKWMEKHRDFISDRCGLPNCVFGLDVQNGHLEIDATIARRELGNSFVIETAFDDRDLFSSDAPRQHMPHYVSDVIKPLIACEIILGSGRKTLRPFSLQQEGSISKLIPINRPNTDVKPVLLLRPETWARPESDWVRKFAGFFENPSLSFTMIHLDRPSRSRKENDKLKLRVFQSVLTSNVNPYEPYGLFGTSGKNIVFARNGISRDPPWTMGSMHERPCRVSVTALTRIGARALLGLGDLEKTIKSRAKMQNMRADFQVVDFTSMSFSDQVKVMQNTHVLIATHGAGNANIIFMRPGSAFVEVFPFSYKAGPFDGFARIFGLEYFTAMSAPQTEVFKACMHQHEKNEYIRRMVFEKWNRAVEEDKRSPWVHRLEFEKEFGEPGKSQGMTTRGCVRLQQLRFNIDAVSNIAIKAGKSQCFLASNTA